MSYVEHCKKHGQYHGEICGECFEDLQTETVYLREALRNIISHALVYDGVPEFDFIVIVAQSALEKK